MMAVAIITIIPSKDYMRYWAFQISFVPENSYNRHCHQERDVENSHHARSPQEGLIRRESKTMKVGLLGTKAWEAECMDGRTPRRVHALSYWSSILIDRILIDQDSRPSTLHYASGKWSFLFLPVSICSNLSGAFLSESCQSHRLSALHSLLNCSIVKSAMIIVETNNWDWKQENNNERRSLSHTKKENC